ncbi:MAG: ATP-binding cassette domain-containing protein [Nocardioidaceae bacterium]|nr:ATP-binding cassette domain-containing protein [Nocardioidaceae bacterium]
MTDMHHPSSTPAFLEVDDLTVRFPTRDGVVQAVTGLSYKVELGKTLGIVGESGSGKSVSSLAVMGLHDLERTDITGSIKVEGQEVVGLSENRMRKLRGNAVSMIFQDPLTALHPFFTIGDQIVEGYKAHHSGVSKKTARAKAVEMLERVGIPQPNRRVDDYPHQFSGGMRQRAMIAMSLVNDPKLIIADEPTTALDVTVQAQILDLLQELQRDFGSAIVIITHDLGVVAEMADEVLVMYGGRCVEHGGGKEVLTHPEMPYTAGLLSSVPDLVGDPRERLHPIPGTPPSLLSPPRGCAFNPRCGYTHLVPGEMCTRELPPLESGGRGSAHLKRCHLTDSGTVLAEQLPVYAGTAMDPGEPAGPTAEPDPTPKENAGE